MGKKYFIAGTDTDVGKTLITTALLSKAASQGLTTAAIKPVAAGCEQTEQGLRNDDALALMEAMTMDLPYQQVNPIALEPAIAPHIAAGQQNKPLRVGQLAGFCRGIFMQRSDLLLVEGAGGWRVPLNRAETLADLAKELELPVILVVGMKLGCINHALLTIEAIQRDGLPVAGWVANSIDPNMSCYKENVATLRALIPAPLLGEVPYLETLERELVANYLDLTPLQIN